MRVLLTSFALNAHYLGTAPLAWALRTAGHEVRVASQPLLVDTITKTGLTAVPVGQDHDLFDLMGEIGIEASTYSLGLDLSGGRPELETWDFLKGANTVLAATFYGPVNNDSMIDDLVSFARDWQPDLVIWEPFTFAGPIAARVTGAAHARLLWGSDLFLHLRQMFLEQLAQRPEEHYDDPLAEWLTWTLERYGHTFDDEILHGQWTIDQMPASVRLPVSLEGPTLPMRYVPYNGVAVVPDWLREPPKKPRVCLTLGVTAREMAISTFGSLDELFDTLADLDVEIVATLDSAQRDSIKELPDNVRAVEFVPMHALMPTCSAVLHHGGAGTWSTASLYGVPQLIFASVWDNPYRAQRTRELGAGLTLDPDQVTPTSLRENLVRLLEEPSFAEGARELRDEMLADPAPNDVVPLLEELTAEHKSVRTAGRG